VMPSASFAVTYTSVYTNSEPGRVFWGVDDEEVSERGIPRVIVLGYDGIHMQPFLSHHLRMTYRPRKDPQNNTSITGEVGLVDYPMDLGDDGDDDDGNSSRDDVNDEDEDDEDEEEEEEEEHLAPANSAVVALVDVVTAALPSPPPPSLYIPPPVDCRDDIPESERPPRKRLCLFALGSRYEVGESSTARPTRGRGVNLAKTVPEIAPMTVGEVNTRVIELAELHEHDTQDLYALLEDA
ncbi:hypothetical protein Tco_0472513, partial [Tanacetum coccineum]